MRSSNTSYKRPKIALLNFITCSTVLTDHIFFVLHVEVDTAILVTLSKEHLRITITKTPKRIPYLRAVCCKNRLRVCKIEKSDFLKICQNKGFGEVVLKI